MGYLRRKIVLIMILCMALSVSLVGALSVRTSRRIVNENAVQRLELLCQENQLRLDAVTDSIEQSVDVLASGVLGALDDPASFRSDADYVRRYSESLRSLLLTAAENTNGSMSVYLRFNPDITEPTSGLFLVRNKATGIFESQTPTDLSLYSPDYTEHVGWYYTPVRNGCPSWMPPYQNENINAYMISYVVPLYLNGTCYGIVGMDIDFDLLRRMVNGISIYDTGYAFLVDAGQNVIIHPSLDVYTPLNGIGDGSLARLFVPEKLGVTHLEYEYGGVRKSATMAQLNNGMILVLSAPEREIFRDTSRLTLQLLLVSLGSLAFVTLIAVFGISRMLKPAATDALTGVNNRQAFLSRTKQRLSSGHGAPYALIMLDIDHFKQVNDTLGHAAGDSAIRQVAEHLNRVLAPEDIIGRFGGDEFLAFMQCGSRPIVVRRMEQLRERLSHGGEFFSGGLTCSTGIVFTGDYSLSTERLLEQADAALYSAKQQGRDRYVFYSGPEK